MEEREGASSIFFYSLCLGRVHYEETLLKCAWWWTTSDNAGEEWQLVIISNKIKKSGGDIWFKLNILSSCPEHG